MTIRVFKPEIGCRQEEGSTKQVGALRKLLRAATVGDERLTSPPLRRAHRAAPLARRPAAPGIGCVRARPHFCDPVTSKPFTVSAARIRSHCVRSSRHRRAVRSNRSVTTTLVTGAGAGSAPGAATAVQAGGAARRSACAAGSDASLRCFRRRPAATPLRRTQPAAQPPASASRRRSSPLERAWRRRCAALCQPPANTRRGWRRRPARVHQCAFTVAASWVPNRLPGQRPHSTRNPLPAAPQHLPL